MPVPPISGRCARPWAAWILARSRSRSSADPKRADPHRAPGGRRGRSSSLRSSGSRPRSPSASAMTSLTGGSSSWARRSAGICSGPALSDHLRPPHPSRVWFRFEWQFAVGAVVAPDPRCRPRSACSRCSGSSSISPRLRRSSRSSVTRSTTRSSSTTVSVRTCAVSRHALPELIDRSVNETLARTMMTSLTVLLALIALVVFGGGHPRLYHRHALGRRDRLLLHGLRRLPDDSPSQSPARGRGASS